MASTSEKREAFRLGKKDLFFFLAYYYTYYYTNNRCPIFQIFKRARTGLIVFLCLEVCSPRARSCHGHISLLKGLYERPAFSSFARTRPTSWRKDVQNAHYYYYYCSLSLSLRFLCLYFFPLLRARLLSLFCIPREGTQRRQQSPLWRRKSKRREGGLS